MVAYAASRHSWRDIVYQRNLPPDLQPLDIRTRGGIDFIDIDDEAETKGTEKTDKALETPAARREAPVHPS